MLIYQEDNLRLLDNPCDVSRGFTKDTQSSKTQRGFKQ